VKWLLDTNAVSEQVRRRPDPSVLRWIAERPRDQVGISAVTMAELRAGALAAAEPRRTELIDWLTVEIERTFGDRIVPVSVDVLMDWLHLGRRLAEKRAPRPAADTIIAATARVHGLIVVTRNAKDFAGTGVTVYNPWTEESTRMDPA